MNIKITAPWLIALAFVQMLLGCASFEALSRDLQKLERVVTLGVTIDNESESTAPHIACFFDVETRKLANISIVAGPGRHEMRLLPGRYFLAAFEDRNENMEYDDGESASFYGEPEVIEVGAGKSVLELHMQLATRIEPPSESELTLGAELKAANPELDINNIGTVAKLEDARFEPEKGQLGMWRPVAFIEQELHGIYMLEEFDSDLTPVLFVHGIGGTPRDFSKMIDSLDSARFQAWAFFYPSSLRLEDLGLYLQRSIELMRAKYRFGSLALVGHSMGGLVATNALMRDSSGSTAEQVVALVTIASPLGGIGAAQLGVDYAPTVMPCWYDLAPGSEFLSRLFRSASMLTPYYLFFGFERSGLGGVSSDGTVPLKSQLRPEAQDLATEVIGIDAGHVGVLADPYCHSRLGEILRMHAPRQ